MNGIEEGEARFYINAYSWLDKVGSATPNIVDEGSESAPKLIHPHAEILRYFADRVQEEDFSVIIYLHSLEYDIRRANDNPEVQQYERMRQFKNLARIMFDYGQYGLNSAASNPSNN